MLYKQKTTSVEKYVRSNQFVGFNELGELPRIQFLEEEVSTDQDGNIDKRPCSTVEGDFSTPLEEYPLRNPETDEIIGTTTDQQLYVLLYSKYRQLGILRDAKNDEQEAQNSDTI